MPTGKRNKAPGPNRTVLIFNRTESDLSGPAAAKRVVRALTRTPTLGKPRPLRTVPAVLETMADGTPVVLTAALPQAVALDGYFDSNGHSRVMTVVLVSHSTKRQAVRVTPSLGVGWGQMGRAWLSLELLGRALAAGGRARVYCVAQGVVRRVGGSAAGAPQTERGDVTTSTQHPAKQERRESIHIQAVLAYIGTRMGHQVWIAKADRRAIAEQWGTNLPLLDRLPLNYEDDTLKTIERIDVLWVKERSIRRAFEVEHSTSIHSGILRMANLLAVQPNMDIRLHIVAPDVRRQKVFEEMTRPVFSSLERGPLAERCTFIPYSSVVNLEKHPLLAYMTDRVLEEFEEKPTHSRGERFA